MAIHESEQLIRLDPNSEDKFLEPNEQGGRERVGKWNFNTTDDIVAPAVLAENDTIRLVKVPANSLLLGLEGYFEAMGANQVAQLGIEGADGSGDYDNQGNADDPDFFTNTLAGGGIDVSSAGEFTVGKKQAENFLYVTEKEVFITLTPVDTVGSDAYDTDKDFDGVIHFVSNT